MSPTQQPVGQVAALHSLPPTQLPSGSQAWLGPHVLHAWPFAPHASGVVETTHWLPTQQPGQFAGPHVGRGWQVRAFGWPSCAQTSPRPHALHCSPCFPQAVVSLPVTH